MTTDLVPILFAILFACGIIIFFLLVALQKKEQSYTDLANLAARSSRDYEEKNKELANKNEELTQKYQEQEEKNKVLELQNKDQEEQITFLKRRITGAIESYLELRRRYWEAEAAQKEAEEKAASLKCLWERERERNNVLASMEITAEFLRARQLVYDDSSRFVFISGGAGTGKSQFIKYVLDQNDPTICFVAPTGLAARNINGQTIHSCFSFKVAPYATHESLPAHEYLTEKFDFLRRIRILVIDEISMVRSDMLDLISMALAIARKDSRPFGGVKIVAVGDLYQLPPIVDTKKYPKLEEHFCTPEDRLKFREWWRSPWFFDAHIMRDMPIEYVEFTKQFRQTGRQREYADSLNVIRTGCEQEVLAFFNQRVHLKPEGLVPHVFPTNWAVKCYNNERLRLLPDKIHVFTGIATGSFADPEYGDGNLPVTRRLVLKAGAAVMFVKNGVAWKNGSLGEVIQIINENSVEVRNFDDGKAYVVEPVTWEDYQFDKEDNLVLVGTYTQLPLVLAWAFTVHKTQGLTFEQLVYNPNRTFDDGMSYVALSRTKTIDGLFLEEELRSEHIRQNGLVRAFYQRFQKETTNIAIKSSGGIAVIRKLKHKENVE